MTDIYTKFILTVIAGCLISLCFRNVNFAGQAIAQPSQQVTRVLVVNEVLPVALKSIQRGTDRTLGFSRPSPWDSIPVYGPR